MQRILRNGLGKGVIQKQLIKNQVTRAFQSASSNSANNSKREKETGMPLVTTFHPRLKNFSGFIKRNLQYLYADQEVMAVVIPAQEFQKFKQFLGKVKKNVMENGASSA